MCIDIAQRFTARDARDRTGHRVVRASLRNDINRIGDGLGPGSTGERRGVISNPEAVQTPLLREPEKCHLRESASHLGRAITYAGAGFDRHPAVGGRLGIPTAAGAQILITSRALHNQIQVRRGVRPIQDKLKGSVLDAIALIADLTLIASWIGRRAGLGGGGGVHTAAGEVQREMRVHGCVLVQRHDIRAQESGANDAPGHLQRTGDPAGGGRRGGIGRIDPLKRIGDQEIVAVKACRHAQFQRHFIVQVHRPFHERSVRPDEDPFVVNLSILVMLMIGVTGLDMALRLQNGGQRAAAAALPREAGAQVREDLYLLSQQRRAKGRLAILASDLVPRVARAERNLAIDNLRLNRCGRVTLIELQAHLRLDIQVPKRGKFDALNPAVRHVDDQDKPRAKVQVAGRLQRDGLVGKLKFRAGIERYMRIEGLSRRYILRLSQKITSSRGELRLRRLFSAATEPVIGRRHTRRANLQRDRPLLNHLANRGVPGAINHLLTRGRDIFYIAPEPALTAIDEDIPWLMLAQISGRSRLDEDVIVADRQRRHRRFRQVTNLRPQADELAMSAPFARARCILYRVALGTGRQLLDRRLRAHRTVVAWLRGLTGEIHSHKRSRAEGPKHTQILWLPISYRHFIFPLSSNIELKTSRKTTSAARGFTPPYIRRSPESWPRHHPG